VRELLGEFRAFLSNRRRERSNAYVVDFRRVTLDGSTYYLPKYALHRPACREFLEGRFYEPETHALVAKLLAERPGDMVHAGTFFGDMLPSFSRACGGTVFAFEPVLENYVLARLCVERNAFHNIALFHAGLGDALGVGRVDVGGAVHRGGGSEMADSGQTTTLMRIDNLELTNLAVLQLDVEGYELPALKGAQRTIDRCKPVILIEDYKKTSAALLRSLEYERSGEVPGLDIWTHRSASARPLRRRKV